MPIARDHRLPLAALAVVGAVVVVAVAIAAPS